MTHKTVADCMTPAPLTIGRDQPLTRAHEVMRAHGIRHLPVLDGGKLVGIVSLRDLWFIETLKDVVVGSVAVEEAMTPDPVSVSPTTPVTEAARIMAEHRYGALLVTDGPHLVGVFTTIDALRALVVIGEQKS
jgi:acetoin utilization protein AcuB